MEREGVLVATIFHLLPCGSCRYYTVLFGTSWFLALHFPLSTLCFLFNWHSYPELLHVRPCPAFNRESMWIVEAGLIQTVGYAVHVVPLTASKQWIVL